MINVDGELCTCGRHGCWEAYASATALIRQTRQAMVANPDSAMWRIAGTLDKVDGRTAFDAMRAGDVVGKKVVDRYIQYIACGLINVINIFQPEVLCIGGGICKEGDHPPEALGGPYRQGTVQQIQHPSDPAVCSHAGQRRGDYRRRKPAGCGIGLSPAIL